MNGISQRRNEGSGVVNVAAITRTRVVSASGEAAPSGFQGVILDLKSPRIPALRLFPNRAFWLTCCWF